MTKTENIHETDGVSVTEELPDPFGFTYFIRDEDRIKIGFTIQPAKRMSSLQTANSRELETLLVAPSYMAEEHDTHQRFAHLRERGEWFRAEPELLDFIEDLKVKAAPAMARVGVLQEQLSALDSKFRLTRDPVKRCRLSLAMGMIGELMKGNQAVMPFLKRQLALIESPTV